MNLIKELDKMLKEAGLTPYIHKPGCDMKDCDCSKKAKQVKGSNPCASTKGPAVR